MEHRQFVAIDNCRKQDRHLRRYCLHCKRWLSYSAYLAHRRRHGDSNSMRSDGEMYSQDAEQSDHGDVEIACSEETIDTEAVDLSNCSVRPRFVPDNAENYHDVVDDEKACGEVQVSAYLKT